MKFDWNHSSSALIPSIAAACPGRCAPAADVGGLGQHGRRLRAASHQPAALHAALPAPAATAHAEPLPHDQDCLPGYGT